MAKSAERQTPLTWLMPMGTLVQFMLPRWVMTRIARVAARLVYHVNHRQRARLVENCRHTLGPGASEQEIDQAVRRTFVHLITNYLDLLRIPVLRKRLTKLVYLDAAPLDPVMAQGKGTILVTPHLGNWDLAGAFLAAAGYPIAAVVEPVPRGWDRTFNRYRSATALQTIPIPDHAAIARALERHCLMALVADRDLTGRGLVCPAFDAYRQFPRGPAAYALRYGMPVVVGYLVFQHRPGRPPYLGVVSPPIEFQPSGELEKDVPALTGIIARRLNELIARYPDQWLVFRAGWREKPA